MIKSWCVNRKAFSWGRPTAEQQVAIARGMVDYWHYPPVRRLAAGPPGRRLLRTARRPRRRPVPTTGRASLPRGRVRRLRHQLRRPRPGHRPAVQHAALPAAAPASSGTPSSPTQSWRPTPSRRPCASSPARSPGGASPRDTSIGGVEVPAGTRIFLNFAAANHQPEVFADPDVFDIHRDRANRHISFGKALLPRRRAGALEARIVLEVIAERSPRSASSTISA